jgi:hypothetical protein
MAAIVRIHAESDQPILVTVAGDSKPSHVVELAPGGSDVALPLATGDFITIAEQATTTSRSSTADPPVLTDLFTPTPDVKES